MADLDSIGEQDKSDEGTSERLDENIPLNPGGVIGGGTWEPEREQETLFGGMSLRKSTQRTCQSIISCAIRKTRASPRSISFGQFRTQRYGMLLQRQEQALNDQRGEAKARWYHSGYIRQGKTS